MKRYCFIGSSRESLDIANAVQRQLSHHFDSTVWSQGVFKLNRSGVESLLARIRQDDFAVFVLANDDLATMRGKKVKIVRDNVLFELGLFAGSIGFERTFFLVPANIEDFHIPSDLTGITTVTYDPTSHNGNRDAQVGGACGQIVDAATNGGALSGIWDIFIKDRNSGGVRKTNRQANGSLFFVHTGHHISARSKIETNKAGENSGREFIYRGRCAGSVITMEFEQKAASHIIGTLTMKVDTKQREMNGVSSYWDSDKAKLVVDRFSLKKRPN